MTHLTVAPIHRDSSRRDEPRTGRRQRANMDSKIEFGDFQTPAALAREVCAAVTRCGFKPRALVEPTCGTGALIAAALAAFPTLKQVLGNDIHADYVRRAGARAKPAGVRLDLVRSDFFDGELDRHVAALPDPLLILGNPPWVTNAGVGALGGANLPRKSNSERLRGIDALTGRSNFDISEWMLRRCLEWLSGRDGMLAMLCKTSVARKLLRHAWENGMPVGEAALYRIDAQKHFDAAVDACLLTVRTGTFSPPVAECREYDALDDTNAARVFGAVGASLVADMSAYRRLRRLDRAATPGSGRPADSPAPSATWRSGIKHDCSKVFELRRGQNGFVNGFGDLVVVEEELIYPLLKSSDLARGRESRRWMLVHQKSMSDGLHGFDGRFPRAWHYLNQHGGRLDRRASSIYKNRPRFSIFGVGPYAFAPWKVAISGLYKKLAFRAIEPVDGKPVVLDDTCYFYPCATEHECRRVLRLLKSDEARGFLESLIFWDAKRPITAGLLNRLDLERLNRRDAEDAERS